MRYPGSSAYWLKTRSAELFSPSTNTSRPYACSVKRRVKYVAKPSLSQMWFQSAAVRTVDDTVDWLYDRCFEAQQRDLTRGMREADADIDALIESAWRGGDRLDASVFKQLKKRLIEKQCQGLLEFLESPFTLDNVAGHHEAKKWLREDSTLLQRGVLNALPMALHTSTSIFGP